LTILFAGGAISTIPEFAFSIFFTGLLMDKDLLPDPNFHKVLERVGKTFLRPGGTAVTKKL
jgi:hypothetical protein